MATIAIRASRDALLVGFRVSPGASQTAVKGAYGDRIKVQLAAPPEKNKANEELVQALSGWLAIPSDLVSLHSGEKSRDKVIAFRGLSSGTLRRRIDELVNGSGRS